MLTVEQKLDINIDNVLRAAGSCLANYTMPFTRDKLRDAMRDIMSESYIAGARSVADMIEGKTV